MGAHLALLQMSNPMPSKKPAHPPQGVTNPESDPDTSPKPPRKTKLSLLLELISCEQGATLQDLTSATGWLPHTARASITGLRKRGHEVCCKRVDAVSRYTVETIGQ